MGLKFGGSMFKVVDLKFCKRSDSVGGGHKLAMEGVVSET